MSECLSVHGTYMATLSLFSQGLGRRLNGGRTDLSAGNEFSGHGMAVELTVASDT